MEFAELITTLVALGPSFVYNVFDGNGYKISGSVVYFVYFVVPSMAVMVLVSQIDAPEIVPVYLGFLSILTGAVRKGRRTQIGWTSRVVRVALTFFVNVVFLMTIGVGAAEQKKLQDVYGISVVGWEGFVILLGYRSWRWALLVVGCIFVDARQARKEYSTSRVCMVFVYAVLKIGCVWLLLCSFGRELELSKWKALDIVLVTRTPLRDIVFAVLSMHIVLDGIESLYYCFPDGEIRATVEQWARSQSQEGEQRGSHRQGDGKRAIEEEIRWKEFAKLWRSRVRIRKKRLQEELDGLWLRHKGAVGGGTAHGGRAEAGGFWLRDALLRVRIAFVPVTTMLSTPYLEPEDLAELRRVKFDSCESLHSRPSSVNEAKECSGLCERCCAQAA